MPASGSGNMASSSSSVNVATALEMDSSQPLWCYVTKLGKASGGGGNTHFSCNFCHKHFTGSYTRCKAHLLQIKGHGIRPCNKINKESLKELKKDQDAAETKKSSAKSCELSVPLYAIEEGEDASKKRKINMGIGPTKTLAQAFENMGRAEMDRRIGRFFFASLLPFNVARSPYWKDVVTSLANSSLVDYVPPSSEKLTTVILGEEKANIEKLLEKMKFSWTQYGVSIVSDGWTDIQRRPLINFIAYSLNGPIFLKCVDASKEYKDVEYLKGLFIEVIKEVGEDNVVQIITDNASVCQRAGMNLASDPKYSHIFWTPCVAHSINLALKSICNPSKEDTNAVNLCSWIEELEHDVRNIRNFVVNHHNALAIFNKHSDLKLLKVSETRFASIIVMMKRIKQVKHALTLLVTDNDWEFYRSDDIVKAQEIKKCILDDEWWDKITYFLQFTEPIWHMLREVDKEGPMLHRVYDMWDNMIEKIQNIIFRHEKKNVALDDSEFFDHVHKILVRRWNISNNPLYCMTHSLNPRYYGQTWLAGGTGRVPPNRDLKVSNNREICLGRLFSDSHRLKIINNEFAIFSSGRSDSLQAAMARDEEDLFDWWLCFGASTPNLQQLALKLLSQPATSSCCERNWSTYSQIHNIKRNKLTSKQAEDLVYVHSNLCLLSRTSDDYSSGSSMYWDVNPEDIDVELEGEHDLHALNMDLTEPLVPSNLVDATKENKEN